MLTFNPPHYYFYKPLYERILQVFFPFPFASFDLFLVNQHALRLDESFTDEPPSPICIVPASLSNSLEVDTIYHD